MQIALRLPFKPQRRPIWKKSDIPMTQTNDEVKVVDEDRLQSKFKDYSSTLMF
jgi:hypothetical protein